MRPIATAVLLVILILPGCKTKQVQNTSPVQYSYNAEGSGPLLTMEFKRGKAFNHPLMALWLEDTEGHYIQTLYVSESIGKGIFKHGDASSGKWMPGEIRRPAALPYWSHKRGVRAEDGLFLPTPRNPVADAYTGPTPPGDFVLTVHADKALPRQFAVLFEINQTWDWNEYWTNNKYPDDQEYKTSCQPALVYKAVVDSDGVIKEYPLKVIGHSHYSGKDGKLYTDLGTMTTALDITREIVVKLP